MSPSRIEPASFLLAAQCLNKLRHLLDGSQRRCELWGKTENGSLGAVRNELSWIRLPKTNSTFICPLESVLRAYFIKQL
jgi:hypothetical protein